MGKVTLDVQVAVETEWQAKVSREELWEIARAALVFHRRAMGGRMDGNHFWHAHEELERALARVPKEAWK